MSDMNQKAAIEAILFAAGYPVEIIKLMETLGCDKDQFSRMQS